MTTRDKIEAVICFIVFLFFAYAILAYPAGTRQHWIEPKDKEIK